MAGLVFGRATLKMDGAAVETEKGASLALGGETRTTRKSSNRVVGYSAEPVEARVECKVLLQDGVTLETFRQATAVTLSFETDTGQQYVVANAWLVEPPKVTDGEGGGVDLIFEGPPAEEVI
jgi:hypothetical protein